MSTQGCHHPRCMGQWQLANCNWLRRPLQDPTRILRSIDLSFSFFFPIFFGFMFTGPFVLVKNKGFWLGRAHKSQRVVLPHVDCNFSRLIRIPKHHSCGNLSSSGLQLGNRNKLHQITVRFQITSQVPQNCPYFNISLVTLARFQLNMLDVFLDIFGFDVIIAGKARLQVSIPW